MQSIVLPHSPFTANQFGQSRFNSGPERLSLGLPRLAHARGYSPRALPPPRHMSSSAPGDDPLETSGEARRTGRLELPQPVTTLPTTTGIIASEPSATTAAREPTLPRALSATDDISQRPLFTLTDPLASSRLPPTFGTQGVPQHGQQSYPAPALATSPTSVTARSLPQKPTRRTKAHVASACVNCKKKHLGCDSARPCRRCVVAGKAATCVDVTHKKRGRPPLKAEDPSLRSYATQLGSSAAPGEPHQAAARRTHMHRATSSREIRPMTDLQMPGASPGTIGMRAPAGQPQQWPPSVFPHAVDSALSMQGHLGHRRFSSAGSTHYAAAQAPGFYPMAGGFSPIMGSGRIPPAMGRPLSSYGNQVLPSASSPPPYHQGFGGPISPYMESSRTLNRAPIGEPPVVRDPREAYLESPVRLPPIFPPMANPGPPPQHQQAHRFSDPYPAPWSYRTQEDFSQERRPPPPLVESIYPEVMGQPGPSVPITQEPPTLSSPARARDDHPPPESEGGDERPTKRRKMAVNDMVNE